MVTRRYTSLHVVTRRDTSLHVVGEYTPTMSTTPSDSRRLQPFPTPAVCVSQCLPVSPVSSQRLQLTKLTPQLNYKELESKKAELVGELKAATAAGMKSMQRATEAEKKLHELEESTRLELEAAHAEHAEEVKTHVADQARIEKLTADNAALQTQRQELLSSLHNADDQVGIRIGMQLIPILFSIVTTLYIDCSGPDDRVI